MGQLAFNSSCTLSYTMIQSFFLLLVDRDFIYYYVSILINFKILFMWDAYGSMIMNLGVCV